jgi:3-hydroxyisobutyrate dehydrogenase-like beta-hydroxyacid dehydrogenase
MSEPVGFAGLGAMGARMAGRLVSDGHRVLTWTRSGRTIEGAEPVASPADLALRTRVTLGCLLDGAAVEDVYLGPMGLLAGVRPGSVLVEHGTFDPAIARAVGEASRSRGVEFLDAPVTGGPEGAEAGTLVAMAGGSAEGLRAAAPLIAAYTRRIVPVGPVGSGVTLKIVNQFLVAVQVVGVAEAAALLRDAGIRPDAAIEVLGGGWAASAMLQRGLPPALSGDFPSATGATIGGLVPTADLAGDALRRAGIDSPMFAGVRRVLAAAVGAGLAGSDPAELVGLYSRGQE